MKKLNIALLLSMSVITTQAYSLCSYDFGGSNPPNIGDSQKQKFPIISGSKVAYKIISNDKQIDYEALQSTLSTDPTTGKLTNTLKLNSEITALEISYKLLETELIGKNNLGISNSIIILDENNDVAGYILIAIGNNTSIQNYKKPIIIWIVDYTLPPSENKSVYTFAGEYKSDTSNIGLYLNKKTSQLGLVIDNKNLGYVATLNSKISSIGLQAEGLISGFEANSKYLDKIISSKVITDKSKFTNTFPTGTKGICSNS